MRSDIPQELQFDDNTMVMSPTARVTIERRLPAWESIVTDSVATPKIGHTAILEGDNIIRFRYKTNGTGIEYAIINTQTASQSDWDTWVSLNVTSSRKPMWESGDTHYGAMLDVVLISPTNYRLFYFYDNTTLNHIDISISGSTLSTSNQKTVMSGLDKYTSYVSAVSSSVVYVSARHVDRDPAVKQSLISDRVRTVVYKMVYDGSSWSTSTTPTKYPAYNIESNAYRDNFVCRSDADETNVIMNNSSATELISRWGYRPGGGLHAVRNQDGSSTIIYAGTFWNKFGMGNHAHGLHYFIENDNGWMKLRDIGTADYDDDMQLFYDAYVSGSGNLVTWVSVSEPGYFKQYNDAVGVPRITETVVAKLDSTGKYLTEPMRIGGLEYAGAKIVELADGTLYCLGYTAVQWSPPANSLSKNNDDALDISDYVTAFSVQSTARINATTSVSLYINDSLLNDGRFSPGNVLNVYIGNASEPTFRLSTSFIEAIIPSLAQSGHTAMIQASIESILNLTNISQMDDIFPESVINDVVPAPSSKNLSIKHAGFSNGNWGVAKDANIWDETFCDGDYGFAPDDRTIRLSSAPWAFTGGTNYDAYDLISTTDKKEGGPGKVLDIYHPQDKGTWEKDIIWLSSPASTDGFIKISTRFGFTQNKIVDGNGVGSDVSITQSSNYDPTLTANDATKSGKNWGVPLGRAWYIVPDEHGSHRYGDLYVQMKLVNTNDISQGNIGIIENFADVSYVGSYGTYNQPRQWALSTGIIFHAQGVGQKYIFAWESHILPSDASHIDDETKVKENFDSVDYSEATTGDNKLVIITTDNNKTDGDARYKGGVSLSADTSSNGTVDGSTLIIDNNVQKSTSSTTPLGRAMDMMVRMANGKIECYSRPTKTSTGTNTGWTLAFTLDSSRFGAGRIGIYGRGGMGLQFDSLWFIRDIIAQLINKVDFWNIVSSNAVENMTMEEAIRYVTWKAGVVSKFNDLSVASLNSPGTSMMQSSSGIPVATTNQVIEGEAYIGSDKSVSVMLRCVEPSSPSSYIEIKFDGTTQQVRKTVYLNGTADTSTKDNYPIPTSINTSNHFSFKVTAIDNKYSMWMNNVYVGVFIEDTELGSYTAISAAGSSPYISARIPELYEIPEYVTLDTGASVLQSLKKIIGNRRIKIIPQLDDGSLLFTYSSDSLRENAGSFHNSLLRTDLTISNNVISRATVEGAYAKATYVSDVAGEFSTKTASVSQPNIFLTEHCYREAEKIVKLSMERRVQSKLVGIPRFTVEAEDVITVTIDKQSIATGDHIVDDVVYTYRGNSSNPSLIMTISTRQLGVF